MSLAVAMLVFSRPGLTARVLKVVATYRPATLVVVADGPRDEHPEDISKCEETRRLFDNLDWECRLVRNFAQRNMGPRLRVATGLNWVFEQVEEAIILEDDCLPSTDFFPYCEEVISRYRDDPRVMMVSGTRFFPVAATAGPTPSYAFSRYTNIWGWATWRRAWQLYDLNMQHWPALKASGWLKTIFPGWWPRMYWTSIFDRAAKGRLNAWDYQWLFAVWRVGGYCVVPARNLVSNIGFTPEATHYHPDPWYAELDHEPLAFPLIHPETLAPADLYDSLVERHCHSRDVASKVADRLRRLVRR